MKSSFFVTSIDLSLKDQLLEDLQSQGFTISSAAHAFFSAKKPGISCTLYHSGKLSIQGKNKDSFIELYLEPNILKNLSFTHPASLHDPHARIGMDEAGKGDFFGPLCVASLFMPDGGIERLLQIGVKDSKSLSDEEVLQMSRTLRKEFPCKVLALFPETYNRLYVKFGNLNHLLAWAHTTALEDVASKTGASQAILDQFAHPSLMLSCLQRKKLSITLTQKTKGEQDPSVAAASILARASFLEGIQSLEKKWNLSLPKGAGSPVLQAAKSIMHTHGANIFSLIAKTHFKTFQELIQ